MRSRWLASLAALLAVAGCGNDSGGDPGPGGTVGTGGTAGVGGGASVLEHCEGAENFARCEGPDSSLCMHESCLLSDCAEAEEGDRCFVFFSKSFIAGVCDAGFCQPRECEVLGDGAVCSRFGWQELDGSRVHCQWGPCEPNPGRCLGGDCRERCQADSDCSVNYYDPSGCRLSRCLDNGLCDYRVLVEDGTVCTQGTCEGGECVGSEECIDLDEEGAACQPSSLVSSEVGVCLGPVCISGEEAVVGGCEEAGTRRLPCRTDLAPSGFCADGVCVAFDCEEVADGAHCHHYQGARGPFFGICSAGVCVSECDALGQEAECRSGNPLVPDSYGERGVCIGSDCAQPVAAGPTAAGGEL